MAQKTIDFEVVREIALALPDVEEGAMHGAPSWKVRGKLFTCPAIHSSAEPDTLAVKLAFEQRDRLIAAAPGIYYVTDHYVNNPIALVRLSRMNRKSLRDLLGLAWRFVSSQNKPNGRRGRNETRSSTPEREPTV